MLKLSPQGACSHLVSLTAKRRTYLRITWIREEVFKTEHGSLSVVAAKQS